MKLIAEQIKLLRERKEELENKRNDYLRYCESRDSVALDGNSIHPVVDYQEELSMSNTHHEIHELETALSKGEFVMNRNFDTVDIGTKFSIAFEDDAQETLLLTEVNPTPSYDSCFVSLESDLGKAVYGKKEGEKVQFVVKATGRPLSVTVTEIKRLREDYEHFIRELPYSSRGSSTQRKLLAKLGRENDIESSSITESQLELIYEELNKISNKRDASSIKRKTYLEHLAMNSPVVHPYGGEIGVGSKVSVLLQDGDETIEKTFELINRAYSTELDPHYVERISPLGSSIMGLKQGDTFTVLRKNQKSIKGIVSSVENYKNNKKTR